MCTNRKSSRKSQGNQTHLKFAMLYHALGWNVIPIDPVDGKKSLVKWKKYQEERVHKDLVRDWWTKNPNANIGIVTGALSGLVVLDADSEKAQEFIKKMGCPLTPVVATAKGRHIYFRHPGGRVRNRTDAKLGLDVRGDGAYIVAPPSMHPSGKLYEWLLSPWDRAVVDTPDWVMEHVREVYHSKLVAGGNELGWVDRALMGVKDGNRNTTAAKLAGYFISRGLPDNEISSLLLMWNERNRPPLPVQKIHQTVNSVRATHNQNQENANPIVFPDVMSGLAGDFAELYSDYLEPPEHFFFMAFLTCLGAALSNRLMLASEIQPQPRLFTVLLGESADDRKSTVLKKTIEFFEEAIPDQDIDMAIAGLGFDVCWGVGSAEGLQKKLANTPRVLLCLDEFKHFVAKSKIQASVLLPCVNTLFENNKYENQTKRSQISLDNAHLSLLAATTTDTWNQIWSPEFTAIGFDNRLFLVPGKGRREFSLPSKIPLKRKKQIIERLRGIVIEFDSPKELEVPEAAWEIYDEWYRSLKASVYSKRLDTYALRLMPLLAVNIGKKEIDQDIAEKVIELCDWQFEVRRRFAPIDADNRMAKMEQRIRRVLQDAEKTQRELQQLTNANRDGLWYFSKALENLEQSGEIRRIGKRRIWSAC